MVAPLAAAARAVVAADVLIARLDALRRVVAMERVVPAAVNDTVASTRMAT